MSPGYDRGRPRQETPPNVVVTDNLKSTAERRCRRCSRPLTRPESRARELGPRCLFLLGEVAA